MRNKVASWFVRFLIFTTSWSWKYNNKTLQRLELRDKTREGE